MADQMNQEEEAQVNNPSSTNTILLVIIVAAAVIFAGWWFMGRSQAPTDESADGVNVEITFPDVDSPESAETEVTSE